MFVAGIALVTAIVFFSIGVGRNPDKLLYGEFTCFRCQWRGAERRGSAD